MGTKKVSSGGSPRGPRPNSKGTQQKMTHQISELPIPDAIRKIVPAWQMRSAAELLWRQLIPVLESAGCVSPVDSIPISMLVNGLALEQLCADYLLAQGMDGVTATNEKGAAYVSPVANFYLGIRKSNLASMVEAGITRIRRDSSGSEDKVLAYAEMQTFTTINDRIRFWVKDPRDKSTGGSKGET